MATALDHAVGRSAHGGPPRRDALGIPRTVLLGGLGGAAVAFLITLFLATGTPKLGHDFRAGYLLGAEAVRETGSPYVPPGEPVAAGQEPYVYPPQLAIVLVPATLVPKDVAAFLAAVSSLAALMAALLLLGVRDPACYATLILWAPAWNALEMANVSAVLALGVAVAWRYRSNTWPPALALGLAISTKLYLWPLLVWTTATGRVRTSALAACLALITMLVAWSAVGLETLVAYPDQIDRIATEDSYSMSAIATEYGGSPVVGNLLLALAGGSFLALTVLFGRRHDDFRALTCAIAATLTITPVVWQHYLVVLVVPLALARPRFSALWLLPLVLWMCPRGGNGEGFEVVVPMIVTFALVTAVLLRPRKVTAPVARVAPVRT